jgi:general stress protein 26
MHAAARYHHALRSAAHLDGRGVVGSSARAIRRLPGSHDMSLVSDSEREEFFAAVEQAAKQAIWCALATHSKGGPRVRMVHPTWEGETLWVATGTGTPKALQIQNDPRVDVQFQVAPPDFVHLCVRGTAELVDDEAEKKRVWDVLDYDLSQFWSGGPTDPSYVAVKITPERVELSKMFGSTDKRVWRRA